MSFKQDQRAAQEAISKARDLNPGSAEVLMEYARSRCYQGYAEEAIAAARRALDLDPASKKANHFLGHILYFSRHYDDAIQALQWGDFEKAFRNLDLAFEYGDPGLCQLYVDPSLDPIREDPRFIEMLRQIGIEPPQQ
jgi:tetratricopeptide (TPR) repeat protein